jgi:enhancing lycopene biosynthesis protein 2
MSKVKYNPEINLGNIIQIGVIVLAAVGLYTGMKVHEAEQDGKILRSAEEIVELKASDIKQVEAVNKLTENVSRLDERIKQNVGRN